MQSGGQFEVRVWLTYSRTASISPHYFSWQSLARVAQILWSFHLSHMNSAATYTYEYWHLLRSGCRNTLIYAHTPLNCDISLGSLKLTRLKVEILWNYSCYTLCMVPSKVFASPTVLYGSPPPPLHRQSRIATSTFTTHLLPLKYFFFLWEDSSKCQNTRPSR
jgi:hypothetical protein